MALQFADLRSERVSGDRHLPGEIVTDAYRPSTRCHAEFASTHRLDRAVCLMNALDALSAALDIDGCIGVALGDHASGLTLGAVGAIERSVLDAAVAAATKTLRGTLSVIESIEHGQSVDDLIIDIGDRIHIACPISAAVNGPGLFLYAIFDAKVTGLGLARKHLRSLADEVIV